MIEYEAKVKVFYNLAPLDERDKVSSVVVTDNLVDDKRYDG